MLDKTGRYYCFFAFLASAAAVFGRIGAAGAGGVSMDDLVHNGDAFLFGRSTRRVANRHAAGKLVTVIDLQGWGRKMASPPARRSPGGSRTR